MTKYAETNSTRRAKQALRVLLVLLSEQTPRSVLHQAEQKTALVLDHGQSCAQSATRNGGLLTTLSGALSKLFAESL